MPVMCNAHDHARAARSSSIGAGGKPLEIWLHYLAMLPSVDPYLAAAVSLSRSALGGQGVVMVHYNRVQGLTDYVTEVKAVAKAARDVGVRVGFAVGLRDRNPLVYGPSEPIVDALPPDAAAEIRARFLRPMLPVTEQLALVDDAIAAADHAGLQRAIRSDRRAMVLGCACCARSRKRRRAPAAASTCIASKRAISATGRIAKFPDGIIRYLDSIGFLSPRLTLAHCTWARPDELELLAERGVTISVNTSSNLGIRSGIAPLAEMKRRGCRIAFGIDGLALDEDDDSLREMRLTHLLHGGWGFEVDVSRADILTSAWRNGRFSVLNRDDGGQLAEGGPRTSFCSTGRRSTTTGSNPISIRAICCSHASPRGISPR